MTDPDSSRADDWNRWIAGYVDGELDEAMRRKVETRLARDPAAADTLRDQEQFSPANRELWDTVALPEPAPAEWATANDRIAAAVFAARQPAHPSLRRAVRLGGLAAAVALGWVCYEGLNSPAPSPATPPPAIEPADDPLGGFAVLPIADPADVEIVAIRGDHPDRFLVAEHPFPDGLPLAGPEDVTVDAPDDPSR